PGTRLVHRNGAAAERRAIELLDRLVGLLVTRHRDEREAARTSGHAVAHDRDRVDGADLAGQLLELGLAGLERKVADEEALGHGRVLLPGGHDGRGAGSSAAGSTPSARRGRSVLPSRRYHNLGTTCR